MVTALEKWRSITLEPPVVEFMFGLFNKVGIRIIDTGEELTCIHEVNCMTFEPGIDSADVDYTVEIESFQVDRLADNARTGEFDEAEKYRIISALFTPATAASLKVPIFSNFLLRWLAGVEDLIHVHLESPVPNIEEVCHTLIFVRGQWIVVSGLHGVKPGRVYRLTLDQAQNYQRQALVAMKTTDLFKLFNFSGWYRQWREGVSLEA